MKTLHETTEANNLRNLIITTVVMFMIGMGLWTVIPPSFILYDTITEVTAEGEFDTVIYGWYERVNEYVPETYKMVVYDYNSDGDVVGFHIENRVRYVYAGYHLDWHQIGISTIDNQTVRLDKTLTGDINFTVTVNDTEDFGWFIDRDTNMTIMVNNVSITIMNGLYDPYEVYGIDIIVSVSVMLFTLYPLFWIIDGYIDDKIREQWYAKKKQHPREYKEI